MTHDSTIPPFHHSNFKTMEGKRSEKIADLIRKEVSEMFLRTVKDPRIGLITITKVQVTGDCRSARIYFSVPGSEEERNRSMQGLDSAKGYVRRELARRVNLRYTPEIIFKFDPSIEYAIHIGEVLQSLQKEREENPDENGWPPHRG
jgi:ribosome-binding factor A